MSESLLTILISACGTFERFFWLFARPFPFLLFETLLFFFFRLPPDRDTADSADEDSSSDESDERSPLSSLVGSSSSTWMGLWRRGEGTARRESRGWATKPGSVRVACGLRGRRLRLPEGEGGCSDDEEDLAADFFAAFSASARARFAALRFAAAAAPGL